LRQAVLTHEWKKYGLPSFPAATRGIKTVPACHDANFLFTVVEEINKSAWKFNSPAGGGYPLDFLVILIARQDLWRLARLSLPVFLT
jgi:hypothetical protein